MGALLTVDHFRPTSRGGADDESNWVYSCSACNTFKAAYWNTVPNEGLLHPLRDDVANHIEEREGFLVGLTPRGERHIERLHLNREQLITQRQVNARDAGLADRLRRSEEHLKRAREILRKARLKLN